MITLTQMLANVDIVKNTTKELMLKLLQSSLGHVYTEHITITYSGDDTHRRHSWYINDCNATNKVHYRLATLSAECQVYDDQGWFMDFKIKHKNHLEPQTITSYKTIKAIHLYQLIYVLEQKLRRFPEDIDSSLEPALVTWYHYRKYMSPVLRELNYPETQVLALLNTQEYLEINPELFNIDSYLEKDDIESKRMMLQPSVP